MIPPNVQSQLALDSMLVDEICSQGPSQGPWLVLILDFQTLEEIEQRANRRKKSECAMQAGSEATEMHSRSIFLRPKKK